MTKEKDKNKPGVKGVSNGSDDNKYKYDILKVIEKRNQEEEAIEELIKEFEAKIDLLFEYVHTDDSGKRLIAKMQAGGLVFDSDEIKSMTILQRYIGSLSGDTKTWESFF